MVNVKRLTLRIDENLFDWLNSYAEKNAMSQNEAIKRAIMNMREQNAALEMVEVIKVLTNEK